MTTERLIIWRRDGAVVAVDEAGFSSLRREARAWFAHPACIRMRASRTLEAPQVPPRAVLAGLEQSR
jgi:hypothetical protein